MTDPYLLLTPVLALLVLALARFVACDRVFKLEEVPPEPKEHAFVVERVLGTARRNFNGWVGMVIHVGDKPLTVTQLGRLMLTASKQEHQVKLVEPAGMGGADLRIVTFPIGTTSDPDSTQGFAYVTLQTTFVLQPDTDYYVVSHEVANTMDDEFYDYEDTTVTTTDVAEVMKGVFFDEDMPGPGYQTTVERPGSTYGPVDFKYKEPA